MKISSKALLLFFLLVAANRAEKKTPTTTECNQCSNMVNAPTFQPANFCDNMLSWVYLFFVLVYLAFLGCYWVNVCLKATPNFRMMKWLLTGLIVIKVLSLSTFIAAYGSQVYYYITQFLYVVHLLMVIQLIISGWTVVKRYLRDVDLVFLNVAVSIQLFAFMASIVIGSVPTDYLKHIKEMFMVVDCTSCFTVLMWFFSTYGSLQAGNDEILYRIRQLFSMVLGYLLIMSLMRELGSSNEPKTMIACVQMLRINAVVETISMIFYSLFLNVFKEYCVLVDRAE